MFDQACLLHGVQVLVEGPNARNPEQAVGRTRHNKLAFFPCPVPAAALKGQLVHMQVEQVRAFTLYGRMVRDGKVIDCETPACR